MKSKQAFIDYSYETKVTANPMLRFVWLGLGLISTGLGFIGYVLPGLPGTVFILIAVYFFARSSPRFYNWLLNHKLFGELIYDWRTGKGLSLKAKIMAITFIAITISMSLLTIPNEVIKILAALCAVGVSIYLWTRPTKKS